MSGRFVWLDDDLYGVIYTALAHTYPRGIEGKADVFHAAWKAAPADPVEAVHHQLVERYGLKYVTHRRWSALGYPIEPGSPKPETTDA